MKKDQKTKIKDKSPSHVKGQVKISATVQVGRMVFEKERQFEAAFDAWLAVLVQRHMDRPSGESDEPTKHQ